MTHLAAILSLYASMTAGMPTAASPARIGVGGPVGSGKTALIERLIPVFDKRNLEVAIVTNDLVTKEDAERLQRSGLIDPARVTAVETGACPHTAIREVPTLNIQSADELVRSYPEPVSYTHLTLPTKA